MWLDGALRRYLPGHVLGCFYLRSEVMSVGMWLGDRPGAWKSWEIPRLEMAIASALSFLAQPQGAVRKGPFLPSHKIFCLYFAGSM